VTQTRPVQNAFSSGEIDPALQSRNDFQRFQTGLAQCRGFVPMRQGGFTRAPGTIWRGTTRNNLPARRIPFQFAVNDSVGLEFTNGMMRVWRYGALVDAADGGIYELATPYTEADLPNLDYVQQGDAIYMVDGRQPMQVLRRSALNQWAIGPADLPSGPFRPQNLTENVTIQCSEVSGSLIAWQPNETLTVTDMRKNGARVYRLTGATMNDEAVTEVSSDVTPPTHSSGAVSITYTRTVPVDVTNTFVLTWTYLFSTPSEGTIDLSGAGNPFRSDHVGTLFRFEPTDFGSIPIWVGNAAASVDDLVRYDGKIYRLTAGDNTGVNPPIHAGGSVRTDASKPTEYAFVSDEVGIVRITSVTNGNTAEGVVLKTIPQPCINEPTYRWSEGAWSESHGYPKALASYRQRMYAANSLGGPRTLWASAIGLFTDFEPSVEADGSFAYTIEGEGSRNEIVWLRAGQRGIYIGALGEVYLGFSAAAGEAIGPTTFDIEMVSNDGVASTPPVIPFGFPIYITRDGTRVNEIRYSFETDGSKPVELTLPSRHLGVSPFQQIQWQSAPDRHFWMFRADGVGICGVYDPDQDVLGWAPYPVADGIIEGIDVTSSQDGAYDIVTFIVRRVIAGQTVRYVEEQAINLAVSLAGVDPAGFIHGFASTLIARETATDTFSLPHLAGKANVWALTEQGHFGPFTVASDGALVLPAPVLRGVIGLRDNSHFAETLNLDAAGQNGDTRGRLRRLEAGSGVEVYQAAGGYVRVIEKHFGQDDLTHSAERIVPDQITEGALRLISGTGRINVTSGYCDQVRLRFEPEGIAPMTMTAIIPNIKEAGP